MNQIANQVGGTPQEEFEFGEITIHICALKDSMAFLEQQIGRLQSRLQPALRIRAQIPDTSGAIPSPDSVLVPMADDIRSVDKRVKFVTAQLISIINDVQI